MKSKKNSHMQLYHLDLVPKDLKNKNIYNFLNKPLFFHSINFAKKLSFVDKIIFSTDSEKYIKIAKKYNNIIIHKRKKFSSSDVAMEEDVLNDLNNFYKKEILKHLQIYFG